MRALPPNLFLPALSLVAHAADDRRPAGIMTDSTARGWLEALAATYKGLPNPHQELINGIIIRSMIIDYAVLDFLVRYQRVAISDLGCGFSTRFHRLQPQVLTWVHVDLPDVVQARCALQPMSQREMAMGTDLTKVNEKSFPSDGEFTVNHLFLCEGVLNHLPREKARNLIAVLHRKARGSTLIGTLMFERTLEKIKGNPEGLGTTFPVWSLSDTFNLETFLGAAQVQRTWSLGKAARMIGLVRPTHEDEASGIVFMATL